MQNKYKKIMELLEFSNGKYNAKDIFRDFVIMFATAIKNKFKYEQIDEDEYLRIVKRYDKKELDIFAKLIAEMMKEKLREDKIQDILGEIFMTIDANSKRNGQFFTPINVAELMAEVTLNKEKIQNKDVITIQDSACGSGVMILGMANCLNKQGVDYKSRLFAECRDIDFLCFGMAYVQLSLSGIPGRVILGDTLQDEKRKIFYTPQYYIGNWYEKIEERGKIKDGRK